MKTTYEVWVKVLSQEQPVNQIVGTDSLVDEGIASLEEAQALADGLNETSPLRPKHFYVVYEVTKRPITLHLLSAKKGGPHVHVFGKDYGQTEKAA